MYTQDVGNSTFQIWSPHRETMIPRCLVDPWWSQNKEEGQRPQGIPSKNSRVETHLGLTPSLGRFQMIYKSTNIDNKPDSPNEGLLLRLVFQLMHFKYLESMGFKGASCCLSSSNLENQHQKKLWQSDRDILQLYKPQFPFTSSRKCIWWYNLLGIFESFSLSECRLLRFSVKQPSNWNPHGYHELDLWLGRPFLFKQNLEVNDFKLHHIQWSWLFLEVFKISTQKSTQTPFCLSIRHMFWHATWHPWTWKLKMKGKTNINLKLLLGHRGFFGRCQIFHISFEVTHPSKLISPKCHLLSYWKVHPQSDHKKTAHTWKQISADPKAKDQA